MQENPIKKFSEWYDEVKNCAAIADPTEVCIATADKSGRPSARIILLKGFDEKGFCFFTNYSGRKAQELLQNPQAALCFYWNQLGKQVRIEGSAEKLSPAESDGYFNSRPEESKLGAWASKQSEELQNREEFLSAVEEYKNKFAGKTIPRPEFWGGFRIVPKTVEFWSAEEFRYHRRELFERTANGWKKKTLYP